MADTKISALPASTTPLAGTEVLPIVQGGATKQVSVANLTAGRAISATQLTLSTGNLIVASGQGIDFSATPGTGTSELLDDYEEGEWTPVFLDFGTPTYTLQEGKYVKVGGVVVATCRIVSGSSTVSGILKIGGLPFASSGASSATLDCFQGIKPSHGRLSATGTSVSMKDAANDVIEIATGTTNIHMSVTYPTF